MGFSYEKYPSIVRLTKVNFYGKKLMAKATLDPETEYTARLFAEKITQQYDTAGIIVFGSRARQTHSSDSDADIAVLLRGKHTRLIPTKLTMADLAFDVLLETGIRIQPLPIWLDEWQTPEHYSNPLLLHNIAKEGIRL